MNILVTLDGENIALTQEQEKLIEEIVDRDFYFVEKDFADICNKSFIIKAYQRGYRWTSIEITQLLNDISEISNEKYCLQPLIVKQVANADDSDSSCYEVIDGQQRLTTMLLILQFLHEEKCGTEFNEYTIKYETTRRIDDQYKDEAKETIKKWFNSNNECYKTIFAEKIKKLFFVWYEIIERASSQDKNSNKIFKTINDNQIALTNAELFKALLLNPENKNIYSTEEQEKVKHDIHQIAFEWDRLEQDLHDNDFWAFICNTPCDDRIHLDYLFELFSACKIDTITSDSLRKLKPIKDKARLLNRDISRFSFNTVQLYLDYLNVKNESTKVFANIKSIWQEIKECYDKLYTWYSDYDLYHYIGFLGAVSEKRQTASIVPDIILNFYKANANNTLDDVRKNAQQKISEVLASHIEYKGEVQKPNSIYVEKQGLKTLNYEYYQNAESKKIGEFLLFFNIWTTTKQKSLNVRFPFYNHKFSSTYSGEKISWDIEHINARQLRIDLSKDPNFDYKNFAKWALEELDTEKIERDFCDLLKVASNGELDNEQKEKFHKGWKIFAKSHNDNESGDNRIQNLALLDSTTNRGYGNSFFGEKRAKIIDNDKTGKYVPIATKNVFLKYYNNTPKFDSAWDENDKRAYMKEINACIDELNKFKGV